MDVNRQRLDMVEASAIWWANPSPRRAVVVFGCAVRANLSRNCLSIPCTMSLPQLPQLTQREVGLVSLGLAAGAALVMVAPHVGTLLNKAYCYITKTPSMSVAV